MFWGPGAWTSNIKYTTWDTANVDSNLTAIAIMNLQNKSTK